jgi:solute carrier family 25 phosphate transporter 3
MGKNVSYDFIKNLLKSLALQLTFIPTQHVSTLVALGSAFLSSIVACLLSQPGDMILTESCKGETKLSFWQSVSKIFIKHGLYGFYFGTKARLAHVASIITSQLMVYDLVNSLLGVKSHH